MSEHDDRVKELSRDLYETLYPQLAFDDQDPALVVQYVFMARKLIKIGWRKVEPE